MVIYIHIPDDDDDICDGDDDSHHGLKDVEYFDCHGITTEHRKPKTELRGILDICPQVFVWTERKNLSLLLNNYFMLSFPQI